MVRNVLSNNFLEVGERACIQVSMGSVGDCYENAMTKGFFAILETEIIDQQPQWCFHNRAQAKHKALIMWKTFTIRSHDTLRWC